jgi:hypothetical protein
MREGDLATERSLGSKAARAYAAPQRSQDMRWIMVKGWHEMDRLNALLEAELNGHHIDHGEAHRLASHISELYPHISGTLARMVERHREGSDRRS